MVRAMRPVTFMRPFVVLPSADLLVIFYIIGMLDLNRVEVERLNKIPKAALLFFK